MTALPSTRDDTEAPLLERLRAHLQPLKDGAGRYDGLLQLVGNAPFVLLGEASHGTHEFYAGRAEITKRLILEKDCMAVAVEADWPDAGPGRRAVGRDRWGLDAALVGFSSFHGSVTDAAQWDAPAFHCINVCNSQRLRTWKASDERQFNQELWMPNEKEIIANARSDYFVTKGKYTNPYPLGSGDFNHHECGWMQSLKLNNEKLVEPYKPLPLPPHRPPSENRYAEMKNRSVALKKSSRD